MGNSSVTLDQQGVIIKDNYTSDDYLAMHRDKTLAERYKQIQTNEWPEYPKDRFHAYPHHPDDALALCRKLKQDCFEQYGFGCIIGNFLADAIGAKDEFAGKCLTDEKLKLTMKMVGGGSHKTASGQGTDDSELATSCMLGLIDENIIPFVTKNEPIKLNMDKVCVRYKDWYESDPFDCGSTVRAALGALTRHWRDLSDEWELIIRESASRDIYKVSEAVNTTSKSNGSLMKICPIAVWGAEVIKNINDDNAQHYKEVIDADSRIIHSEKLTGSCIFIYSAAISYMLNHFTEKDRAQKALDHALELSKKPYANHTADGGEASAQKWIEAAIQLWADCKAVDGYIHNPTLTVPERYKCTEAIGFIKHAFILSFYYLAKAADKDANGDLTYDLEKPAGKEFYFQAVRETISLGGDTDTNACIVGGIVGAYVGIRNIDEDLLQHFFTYDQNNEGMAQSIKDGKGRKRPEWLNMGRNTFDSCMWLHIVRYKSPDAKPKIPFVYDNIKKIPEDEPIKN